MPVVVYVFVGLFVVEVVPSPKFYKTEVGAGIVVFVKFTASLTHTVDGPVKEVRKKLITTALLFKTVLLQPVLLVTVSVTVKLPDVV